MSNSNKETKPSRGVVGSENGGDTDSTTNLQQLFLTLFFGLLSQFDDRYNVKGSNEKEALMPVTSKHFNDRSNVLDDSLARRDVDADTSSGNEHTIDGALEQLEKLIPHDPFELRQSTIYKNTLQLLQWQRDNYLVGDEYADWRKNDRLRQQRQQRHFQSISFTNYDIPYNQATISHHHISSLASKFIPTATVQNLLTPIVTGIFEKETGVLFDPIKQSTINLILDQQKLLEGTIKRQLLQLLDNPRNRDAIKDSTQGIIIQTAKIDDTGHIKK